MVSRKLGKHQSANSQDIIQTFTDNFSFGIRFLQQDYPKRLSGISECYVRRTLAQCVPKCLRVRRPKCLSLARFWRPKPDLLYIQIPRRRPAKKLQKSTGKLGKHSIHPDQCSHVTKDLRRMRMAVSNLRCVPNAHCFNISPGGYNG